jgi:recombination DNA repair RAD52 pathway protein
MDVEKTMEFILEQTAQIHAIQMKAEEHFARHDRDIAEINAILRRAVRLAVQEARAERKRRREADDQLASSQLLTEEKLRMLGDKIDKFVDDMRHPGGNGHPV